MDQPISPSVCILIKGQLSTRYLSGLRQRYGAGIPVHSLSQMQTSSAAALWRNLRHIAPDLLFPSKMRTIYRNTLAQCEI